MSEFFETVVLNIKPSDVIDILIVTFVIYKILNFIRDTRSEQLIKGLMLFIGIFLIADVLNLNVTSWIIKSITTIGILALVIIFQPELRRALEYMGRSKLTTGISKLKASEANRLIEEFKLALIKMSKSRTGALIVFERTTALNDQIETGTVIDADITEQLIGNIFYEGAPLHDGAVIIRTDRLYAAGCVLPLTSDKSLEKELGTRHRAGIGITERSDAVVFIVSEETGVISVAREGKIVRYLDDKYLDKLLHELLAPEEESVPFWKKIGKGEK